MENKEIPKLITPEIIKSIISDKENLRELFHLNEEEGSIEGDSCHISWNTKMIKFLFCDVEININNNNCTKKNGDTCNCNSEGRVIINVSDLSNKKSIELHEKEIKQVKEQIEGIIGKIEKINDILAHADVIPSCPPLRGFYK